jgi:anaerobic selenocysteine-containing dehydrogenase
MSALGDALTRATPPVHALFVYNSNPAAVAPDANRVIEGLCRPDLFTVVHDSFLTDTADYADVVLPAPTHLEQFDIHKSYGHRSILINHPAIAPLGESRSNTDLFRSLAKAMGLSNPLHFEADEALAKLAFNWEHPSLAGQTFAALQEKGWLELNLPRAIFADGGFPTPSGKCEFYSASLAELGFDALPTYHPPREDPATSSLAAQYPLSLNSPPERNFMNTTFANIPRFLERLEGPTAIIHPDDAKARGIQMGDRVVVFNARGSVTLQAKVSDATRPGVITALSVWWRKLSPDGQNINALTSQALTDFAGGATFYDCLVEVRLDLDARGP